MTRKRFIRKAIRRPGGLRRQLRIPKDRTIPFGLLDAVIKANPGETIKNPTKTGARTINVTRLMERRAILARNLKRI